MTTADVVTLEEGSAFIVSGKCSVYIELRSKVVCVAVLFGRDKEQAYIYGSSGSLAYLLHVTELTLHSPHPTCLKG